MFDLIFIRKKRIRLEIVISFKIADIIGIEMP